jgi:hypothetical protein
MTLCTFHFRDVMLVDSDKLPLTDQLGALVPLATMVQSAIVRFVKVTARSHYGCNLYNHDLQHR